MSYPSSVVFRLRVLSTSGKGKKKKTVWMYIAPSATGAPYPLTSHKKAAAIFNWDAMQRVRMPYVHAGYRIEVEAIGGGQT